MRQGKEDRARGEGDVVVGDVVVDGGDECDYGRRKSGMRDRVRKRRGRAQREDDEEEKKELK